MRSVLIAEDHRDLAESLVLGLEPLDVEVRLAFDGADALRQAQARLPDVAVLDIGLPRLDGYAVARRMRQMPQTRDALLVALTGYGQQDDRIQAREAGFDHHMVKPADPYALLDAIAEWSNACAKTDNAEKVWGGPALS